MTKTVIYLRASTNEQATNGCSLAVQRERCQQYAALYGLDIVGVCEDAGLSGKSLDRPGLKRALALLESGEADALLVAKLDRLTRSVRDLAELLETFNPDQGRPALLSVAEQIDTRTAGGRLVLNVLTSVGQWERETIAERTRDALRHKRAAGQTFNHTPYGFDREGDRLVENAAEQAILGKIKALHVAGDSLHAIAATLNAEGIATKKGGRWFASTVRNLVTRAAA